MKLVAFPSRPPRAPRRKPVPGQRLRTAALVIFILGTSTAGLLYWLETRSAEPGMEELMPGYSAANSRVMGIFYGHAGQMMWQWREDLAQPETQAALILAVTAIGVLGCLRVAWLDAQRAKEADRFLPSRPDRRSS